MPADDKKPDLDKPIPDEPKKPTAKAAEPSTNKSSKSIKVQIAETDDTKPSKTKKIAVLHQEADPEPEPVVEEEVEASTADIKEDDSTVVESEVLDNGEEKAIDEASSEPELPEADPTEETENEVVAEQSNEIDDSTDDQAVETDADDVVDDIVAEESDELLAAEDEKIVEATKPKKQTGGQKLRAFFGIWWQNPWSRWATILIILGLVIGTALLPTSRYFILNSAGVRSSASLTVLDDSTQQPLKNVQVSLAGQTGETDKAGNVSLSHLKLGRAELVISKSAFTQAVQNVTVGWGSNPLGSFKLSPSGTQYVLSVSDFLSSKPVVKAEASAAEASAVSNDKGIIKLTIDQPGDQVEVTVRADGYRDETIKFSSNTKATQAIKLVPAGKQVFVSKLSGKYDVYKIDVDGKNKKLILAGTGNERDDIVIAQNPSTDFVAVVSSRDSQRDKDGYLLSTLTLVNLSDDTAYKLAQSERVQIIDWVDGKLIYVQIAAGASADNPKRYRLMSYDVGKKVSKEIAASNYFNDVMVAQNKIYYAPSSVYVGGSPTGLYRVDGDGSNKKTVMADETWNAFRTAYDHIVLSLQQKWYDYVIDGNNPTKLDGSPANLTNRVYVDSPDGKQSLWIDVRDGKGVLISYDIASKKETTIRSQSGLKNPVRWLNNHTIVYRINTDQESADYVYNLEGGEPRKISDVTNTGGIDKWYYY